MALDLDALAKLCEAATRGPWECKDHPDAPFDGQYRILGPYNVKPPAAFDDRDWNGYFSNYDNAVFCAAARSALPALIARLKAAEADVEKLKTERRELLHERSELIGSLPDDD